MTAIYAVMSLTTTHVVSIQSPPCSSSTVKVTRKKAGLDMSMGEFYPGEDIFLCLSTI